MFVCGVVGLCRPAASVALATGVRRLRFTWFITVSFLAIIFLAMMASIGFTSGWRELIRDGGGELLICFWFGILLPFTLAIKRWQHSYLVVLAVTVVSFLVYAWSVLLVSAGA